MERYRPLMAQLVRFLVVGGVSFTIDYGLFTLLYAVGVAHLAASATSFTVSLFVNYALSRKYVFDVNEDVNIVREFTAYVGLNVIALGLNTAVLYVCADVMGMRCLNVEALDHEGATIALDDTDDEGRRASEELGFDLGRRPGGATASTVDEI